MINAGPTSSLRLIVADSAGVAASSIAALAVVDVAGSASSVREVESFRALADLGVRVVDRPIRAYNNGAGGPKTVEDVAVIASHTLKGVATEALSAVADRACGRS